MTKLESSLIDAAREGRRLAGARGALATWQQIQEQCGTRARTISQLGFQIYAADQLREKHIRAVFNKLIEMGRSKGTLQNMARSARYVLRGAGKTQAAEKLTNAELGTDGRCRDGTKKAITLEKIEAVKHAISQMRDQDRADRLAVLIDLAKFGGLRQQEALRAGSSLCAWRRTLTEHGFIHVKFGTKGGRPRDAQIKPADRENMRATIERAIALRTSDYKIWLPGSNLKNAIRSFSNAGQKVGLEGMESFHSLRYRFAHDQVAEYQRQGYDEKSALAATSQDLGHGDGRERYVRQVCLR